MDKKLMKKICLIGDGAVGKTSLIRKFVFDSFDDNYITTIGSKVTKKQVTIPRNGVNYHLTFMIWDILGQRVHNNLHATYYSGAAGAFIVCDMSREETIHNLDEWIRVFRGVNRTAPVILLGNKSDLVTDMDAARAKIGQIAEKHGLTHHATSAKTGNHVEESFMELGNLIVTDYIESKGGG